MSGRPVGEPTIANLLQQGSAFLLDHLRFDLSPWPKTKAYAEAMLARPSFAAVVAKERRLLGG